MNSMTGFGRGEAEQDGRRITIEVKTVNHRYLDINLRTPRVLMPLEDYARTEIKKKLTRGRVEVWDSGRFFHREDATIVEWRFRCVMNDGAVQTFDGLSLVEWTQEGTIRRLQEFGCNLDTYDPYRNGDPPMFREERALWF